MSQSITDIHIHIQPWWQLRPEILERMRMGKDNYDQLIAIMKDPKLLLKLMDDSGIERVGMINYVSPDLMGFDDSCNDFCAEYQNHAPDRLIAFGSVHPRFCKDVDAEMHRLIQDLGIRGIKIHPPHQLFYPNDYLEALPSLRFVYQRCEEWGIPLMIHTGTSFFQGARIKYGDPVCLDDIAVDFPNLKIIMAHGGRPFWTDEAFYLIRRHKNMFMDVSSIPPKKLVSDYFPRLDAIADKVLWGTDWPGPLVNDLRKNVDEFIDLGLSHEIQRKILSENAMKLFPIKG